MKKTYSILLIIFLILLGGCFNQKNQTKFKLEDKYYGKEEFIKIDNISDIEKESYVLFTYNSYCNLAKPCEDTFKEFMEKYSIAFLSIPYDDFKKTELYKTVKYAPSVIVVKKGKIISYLDANSDEDLDKYQSLDDFESWIKGYIQIKSE